MCSVDRSATFGENKPPALASYFVNFIQHPHSNGDLVHGTGTSAGKFSTWTDELLLRMGGFAPPSLGAIIADVPQVPPPRKFVLKHKS